MNLHDHAVTMLTVDWKAGTLRVEFGGSPAAFLVASGLRELRLPRWHPWGPSVATNGVTEPVTRDDGLIAFTIEMHSGDNIEVVAGAFDVQGARP